MVDGCGAGIDHALRVTKRPIKIRNDAVWCQRIWAVAIASEPDAGFLILKLSHCGRPSTLERRAGDSSASGRAGDLQRRLGGVRHPWPTRDRNRRPATAMSGGLLDRARILPRWLPLRDGRAKRRLLVGRYPGGPGRADLAAPDPAPFPGLRLTELTIIIRW